MKNNKLIVLIIACFLLLPFKVAAEIKGCEPVHIELQDIKLGAKGQETTYAIGGAHFVTPTINITWYESSNGSNYTLMDKNSTFDYNVYYKAVLDTTYDELNGGFDEGWEFCGLSTIVVDENGKELDRKSYNSSSNMEYVFDPIWKYKVYLYLENMDYIGAMEVVEGEDLLAQLIPKKNYRLPTEDEVRYQQMVRMFSNGNMSSNYYNSSNGKIEIPSQAIERYIEIHAIALEKTKIEFQNNNYTYIKNSINGNLKLSINFNDIDKLYINDEEISKSNYNFDVSEKLEIYDNFLDNLEVGTYKLRIENNEQYAETTFEVRELEFVEKIIIDFRNISNSNLLTEDQLSAFQFLGIDKGFLTFNVSMNAIYDRNQKILLYMDVENNITLAGNLSSIDNIFYTLSEEELELYKKEYAVSQIPEKIIFIFGEVCKVTLDANGGKFTSGNKYIIDDIINFDYTNFNKPTRDDYKFIGFFTDKTGGKSIGEIMNSEAGIESDMIFYARWEKVEENPKTFDGIRTSIIMGTMSLIGLISVIIYLKKKNKVRA